MICESTRSLNGKRPLNFFSVKLIHISISKNKLIWEQINRILTIWGAKVKLKENFFRLNLVINVTI